MNHSLFSLSLFILVPILSAILILAAGDRRPLLVRWISLLANFVNLVLALVLWLLAAGAPPAGSASGSASGLASGAWLAVESHAWIPSLGVSFTLGLDGLSLLFVILTALMGAAAVLASWKSLKRKVALFHLALALVMAGIYGVFLSVDLFLFAFMWELMLIPMYFLVDVWGGPGRHKASVKFFLFSQAGGILMFVAVVALYVLHGRATGVYSFDYRVLLGTAFDPAAGMLLMLGFFAAFAVKLPVFPLHAWLPDTYTEAPTGGSVLLAALLSKTAGYGMIRFLLPLFPDAVRGFAPIAVWLGVAGIVYGGFMAFAQKDLKRLVSYTSVSHLGFVLVGIFTLTAQGLDGAVIQMLSHGIGTGALFVLVGWLEERSGTRDLDRLGGLWSKAPRMGAFGLVLTLGLVGLPGLGNFIGEFLVLSGSFHAYLAATIVAGFGLVVAMVYALRMFQLSFHGSPSGALTVSDLGAPQVLLLGVLVAALVYLGLFPQEVLKLLATLGASLGLTPGVMP